jgi:hypothetical protein
MGKKTKIEFSEIKPGDEIEVVSEVYGVKNIGSGIAHEIDGDFTSGYGAWYTEEGGVLVIEDDTQDIYRVDKTPVTFNDLKVGDLIRVSFPPIQHSMSRHGDITHERSGKIGCILDSYNDVLSVSGQRLVSRSDFFENAQVEILDRAK